MKEIIMKIRHLFVCDYSEFLYYLQSYDFNGKRLAKFKCTHCKNTYYKGHD